VRRRRTELGLGQRQLGEIAGISSPQGTISQLERGIRHETTHLAALERVLGPRGPIRDALSSDLESPPPESVGGDRSPEGGDPPAVAGSPAQPSPPAPVAESSIEEPASTSVAESEPAVVSPADPDQEARGRTATAGAAATAGAPDAPYDTISPPPAQGASSQPVGEREGCDLASGPASRLPDLSNEGPGSVEDEVDEHPVPPDLLDELVDLRLRLEVAERQIAGYRAEREAPGDRLVLVPAVELADLEARAARVDRAEAELVEARRFGVATERLLDRAEPLHVRRDDDRWIRLGALGNVIDRLVVRANKEAP
jgi:hypothetical protein